MNTFANLITGVMDFTCDDTYKIAKDNDVDIIEEDLGDKIRSYYHNVDGKKLIHVNSRLTKRSKINAINYQLYHALLELETIKFMISDTPINTIADETKCQRIKKNVEQVAQTCTL